MRAAKGMPRRTVSAVVGAAAATIVETNALLDPAARQCVDCKPTQDALAAQKGKLLPPAARAAVARTKLALASKTLTVLANNKPSPMLTRAFSMAMGVARVAICTYSVVVLVLLAAAVVSGVPTTAGAAAPSAAGASATTLRRVVRIPLLLLEVELAWS